MEELPPGSKTVTVRRNPQRKARPPATPIPLAISSPTPVDNTPSDAQNLKVFLRIRPPIVKANIQKHGEAKNVWPKNPKPKHILANKLKNITQICLTVNDSQSVTVSPPQNLQDAKRVKSEVYEGFSHVFSAEASQNEVYDKMVKQLVKDFLNGKSGMLAALGPSGSGKTHTVFGCARDPGMVPLALRHIFSEDENDGVQFARTLYLSVFEILSEKGKSEKIYDLLGEGVDLYLTQSTIKGLQEFVIRDARQAESLIARAMLKRATAITNSNSQSSRSQCIINISYGTKEIDGDDKDGPQSTMLTIVDLAGAEREKKTGNQGLRLLESNFINNTSMVFGLCLRSLLEYQKNPKRPLHKHFQSSLLTRYLRAYLEGKKRMALILTVKPGEEDYLDTSNLLKQASPYMQIKFTGNEEAGNVKRSKRSIQSFPRVEQLKRMKLSEAEASLTDESQSHGQLSTEEISAEKVADVSSTEKLVECKVFSSSQLNGGQCPIEDDIGLAKRDREHEIMLNFAKALWNVLKEYKMKLEMAENEICCLKDDLMNEKKRCHDLENEVKCLRRQSSEWRDVPVEVSIIESEKFRANYSPDIKGSQSTEFQEGKVSSNASFAGPDAFKEQLFQDAGDLLECSCTQDNHVENSRASIASKTKDAISNFGDTDELVVSQTRENEKSEDGAEFTRPGENIEDLKDIEGEDKCRFSTANDVLVLKVADRNERNRDNQELDHSDAAIRFSQSCAELGKISPSSPGEDDGAVSTSNTSESVVCSSLLPEMVGINEDSLSAAMDKLLQEEDEELPDPLVAPKTEQDVSSVYVPEPAVHSNSECKAKPKRRLLPSSCILLKDIGSLAIEDESDKPKGARGKKKPDEEIRIKTKGSESLLRLLRSNLHP